jgi:autotransporter-associated beta strand protein
MTYMRSSSFRLNAFAISRRLAASFLLFSLFEITDTGWSQSQTVGGQIISSDNTLPAGWYLRFINDRDSGVNGAFFTNNGTVQADGNFQVGTYNWAVFTQNAGEFNVNEYLSIARYGGSGALRVNGGWVNASNRPIIVGESGDGYIGINGGGVYAPSGTVLSGNGGSVGSLDLNSGYLVTSQIYKWGAGTGSLNLNGGTLQPTRDEWNYISGLNSANIGGNGAVIDNNGKAPGINQTLTGSGSGSVKFDGSGWTTLRQNNTFTGDTLVRGGTLQIYENGSLYNNGTAAGNIYVNSGASLYFNKQDVFGDADTGSSSPVSITLNGGTINNGNGGVTGGGVFNNIANLTMNGGTLIASGGDASGWNAYELNNVTVGGSSASTITSNTSINGNNDILLSRAGTTTFNVGATGDATGDLKVSAKLTDGNGVVGSLTKTGAGKMVLSAANTYTGETKVLAGTLVVDTGGSIVSSSTTISSGATLQGAGSIAALTVESGGVVKITTASTTSAAAWNTGGTINFNSGSKIDVTGLSLSQQPYVLIRGSSVSGTPILQGVTGFTVANTGNSITLTPAFTYTINNREVTITGYTGTGGDVEIPATINGDPVTSIGGGAFLDRADLSSISIPNSVTSIGGTAFKNCRNLSSMIIPSSVITVGEEAFSGCDGLTSVAIGSGVTTIGSSAFINCIGLTSITIPNNVTSMGNGAFLGCRGLTSLTIGSGVTSIAGSTFLGCTSLTTITIPNSVTSLGLFAFSGCTSLTTITIGSGVTSIGEKAFSGCTSLTTITIPNNVTSMGNLVFFQCYGLTSVEIASGVTIIAPGTFSSCTSLTSVTIPNTVTTIGAQAFRDCTNLATVNFERTSPPTIGSNVFTNIKPSAIGYYPVGAADWSGVTINGLTLTPAVSPKLNQTITFNATPVLTWNGLNSKVVLDARVDSGLPLSFVSSNSQVATVTTDAQVTTVCNLGGSTPSENWAMGLAVDASDNVYVAAQDVTAGNNQFLDKIFKISDGTSVPVVFVGLGNDKPRFLAAHAGYLYVTTSAGVGKVPLTGGSIQYLQLTGTDGSTPHPFTSLSGIAVGAEGNIWVADGDAHAIYKFNSAGVLQQGWAVGWNAPQGLAISPSGDVYVANTVSHEIKKIDPTTGAVTTVAGTGLPGYADGDGTVAQFIYPQGIAFDKEGNLMVVDQQNYRIRKIAFGPSGATVSSLAGGGGSGQASPALDGLGTAAGFNFQIGIGVDSKGNIFSAEGNAKNIRKTRMVGVATIQGAGSATITASQAGNADYAAAAPVTIPVSVTLNAALISSGFSHTLYLGAGASTVTAWGMNSDGRLGVGDMNSPVNWAKAVQGIPLGYTVTGLSAGGTHSLILAGGQVYAAGSDRYGQLGQGGTNRVNRSSFTNVFASPSNPVVAVSAGGNHSLAVTQSGDVYACGDNTYGQLGQSNSPVNSAIWLKVHFQGLTNRIVSVVAGADHNLAVDEGGGVWVWGRNNYGQLGKGTRATAERTPSNLAGVTARSVAAGFSHSLILETSGTVRGFGRNNCGQTGQSATSNMVLVPTLISGLSGIRLISAGTDSSFAIDGVGQLRSWGYNAYGELLLGYASPISSPAVYGPTPSLVCDNVSGVSGGGYSSLAVGAQGVIFGGRNDVGQAGNGPDPDEVVGDYYYGAGSLALTNLTMDLAGTTETLYDQIFVGNGAVTLNGILNLMFVGTYTGPVYGTPQTFDLIWAKNGIVFGTGYQLAFNQAGYLVESAVADKIVEGVSGKVLQATVRAVVNAADLAKAVQTANPVLHQVQSVSYKSTGLSSLSLGSEMEMIYSYERPTGGVMSGAEYFVGGTTYRVEYSPYLNSTWNSAQVTGTTVTPLGNSRERVTMRISGAGTSGFLRLEVVLPP